MGQKKKRLLIGASVVFGLLAAGAYLFYFAPTSAAVLHAENFLFRRMTVTQLDGNTEFRHFFVTNRESTGETGEVESTFSAERQDQLTFGFFDVSIEPTIGLGMFINPTDWFQNEEIRLDDVQVTEQALFVDQLRQFVDDSPGRSLLVVVHGFREAFPSALRKTAFIASVLDVNTPVLVFDWPGNQGSSLRGYRAARGVAKESGSELAAMLELLVREVRPDRLSVLANSMGGQVVVDAFSELYELADFADTGNEFSDIILTAPDVDHQQFNDRFKREIGSMADDLTVYVSSNDRALLMSRLINRGLRLGETTMSPDQLEEAASIADLIDPNSDRITLVDVTPVNRTRNFHNFSLETPEFFDDLFLRLTLDDPTPPNRLIYPLQTPDGTVYWVLTRGR